jgi:hypothetical protein
VRNGRILLHLDLPERIEKTPVKIRLRLPRPMKIESAAIAGDRLADVDGEWITLSPPPGQPLDIEVRTSPNSQGN